MSKWSYIELVRAITCIFMHGLLNKVCSYSPRGGKVQFDFFSGRLKVKVIGVK